MELSTSRRILAVVLALIISLCTAVTVSAMTAVPTLGSLGFFQKRAITGAIVAECEKQLTAKYLVLEAESGIPHAVFETVKNEYPVETSLRTALQNAGSNESPNLYTEALVSHFELLCTDYLDGNKIHYNKAHVHNTAAEAASIFSETVGLHNMGKTAFRVQHVKDAATVLELGALFILIIASVLLLLIFSNKKRAQVYIFGGISGGAAGLTLSALLFRFLPPLSALNVTPAVYKTMVTAVFSRYFLCLALISLLVAVIAWATMLISYRQQKKKKK